MFIPPTYPQTHINTDIYKGQEQPTEIKLEIFKIKWKKNHHRYASLDIGQQVHGDTHRLRNTARTNSHSTHSFSHTYMQTHYRVNSASSSDFISFSLVQISVR